MRLHEIIALELGGRESALQKNQNRGREMEKTGARKGSYMSRKQAKL